MTLIKTALLSASVLLAGLCVVGAQPARADQNAARIAELEHDRTVFHHLEDELVAANVNGHHGVTIDWKRLCRTTAQLKRSAADEAKMLEGLSASTVERERHPARLLQLASADLTDQCSKNWLHKSTVRTHYAYFELHAWIADMARLLTQLRNTPGATASTTTDGRGVKDAGDARDEVTSRAHHERDQLTAR